MLDRVHNKYTPYIPSNNVENLQWMWTNAICLGGLSELITHECMYIHTHIHEKILISVTWK